MSETREPGAATEPRTISGRAWLSGMRPHHRTAATPLVLSIEREAAKPAIEALRAADAVLADLIALEAATETATTLRDVVVRARAAHEAAEPLLVSD